MTQAERLVLLLTADLALAKDGVENLQHVEGIKAKLKEARHVLDTEAFWVTKRQTLPPPDRPEAGSAVDE
jgi:hypothetical protein